MLGKRNHNFSLAECRRIATKFMLAGKDHTKVIQSYVRTFGITERYVYQLARRGGWKSGRKRRSDLGQRKLTGITGRQMEELQAIALGPKVKSVKEAIWIAEKSGIVPPGLVGSHYLCSYILKRNGVGYRELRKINRIRRLYDKQAKARP